MKTLIRKTMEIAREKWLASISLFLTATIVILVGMQSIGSSETRIDQTAAVAMPHALFRDVSLEAKAALVYDMHERAVLFEKNAETQLPLASLTKVPLMLVVSEVLQPFDTVTISRDAVEKGEGGGLGTGDSWRVRDLVDFTLIRSSNAGAEALAEAAEPLLRAKYPDAPDTNTAVWRMNKLAQELGLAKTYFANPSGLDIGTTQPGAMGSARDVATLFAHAVAVDQDLFSGTSDPNADLGPLNGSPSATINTNDALPDIPGLVLGKTGYTDLAGGNVVVVFEVGPGHPVVVVVLGSSYDGRFKDMRSLVDRATKAIAQSL
ncbi:MAG: D-alanyl-D-alanine carboxypeptidase [Parcubacteria group bacterium Gr01-1014_8]|nr:MAG: D-alanyl-D-alanine carboxypeptidase [Parcubacteria group bacterium Gr01-1014_8]